ncbi:MAG: hypothetical protein LBL72_05170 [Candidatus Accumulibacter sp.]|jgi:hypothetical protein|nr:hypothetical protein [Accumulibacter sp.]
MDNELFALYEKAKQLGEIDQEASREETKREWEWWGEEVCRDKECIVRWYKNRKKELEEVIRFRSESGYKERERKRRIEEAKREAEREARRKDEARRLEEYKKFRFGSCKAWDKLSFTGGWVAGTAHHHLRFSAKFPLFLKINKYFLNANEKTKKHFSGENPLLVHERGDEAECSGFGKVGPMPATLIGKHEDGFFVILARIQTNYGRSTCVLNVRPQDLRCNK